MKKIIPLLMICLAVTACSGSQKKTLFVLQNDFVSLKISTNTSKKELIAIASKLQEIKGITINFEKTIFNADGTIEQLELKIKCPDGFAATVQADLYMSDDYYGFFRDYRPESNPPFRCGLME